MSENWKDDLRKVCCSKTRRPAIDDFEYWGRGLQSAQRWRSDSDYKVRPSEEYWAVHIFSFDRGSESFF